MGFPQRIKSQKSKGKTIGIDGFGLTKRERKDGEGVWATAPQDTIDVASFRGSPRILLRKVLLYARLSPRSRQHGCPGYSPFLGEFLYALPRGEPPKKLPTLRTAIPGTRK